MHAGVFGGRADAVAGRSREENELGQQTRTLSLANASPLSDDFSTKIRVQRGVRESKPGSRPNDHWSERQDLPQLALDRASHLPPGDTRTNSYSADWTFKVSTAPFRSTTRCRADVPKPRRGREHTRATG